MEVTTYEGTTMRAVLTALVMDDLVCGRVADHWTEMGLFDGEHANQIGRWAIDFFKNHKKAPGPEIQTIFARWAETEVAEQERIQSISNLLQFLSDGATPTDSAHSLEIADDYFNQVLWERHAEALDDLYEAGRPAEARQLASEWASIDLTGESVLVPVLADMDAMDAAFEEDLGEPLITFDDAAEDFFAGILRRGELISFMGPDKTGKTTFLVDFAIRAVEKGRKVLFFGAGDEDQNALLRRFAIRVTGLPEFDSFLKMPIGWDGEEGGPADDEGDRPIATPILEAEGVYHPACSGMWARKAFRRMNGRKGDLVAACYPNDSLTVSEIDKVARDRRSAGWVPDVIVVDYADILADPAGTRDGLDAIDKNWKALRRLAQEHNALVLTATQSNAAAYGNQGGLLTPGNFSGRKTKIAHVHGMIGINVTREERAVHSTRLNWVVRRKWLARNRNIPYIRTAGCFDVEMPILQTIR